MGTTYTLVNETKKECITYAHLPASGAREIAGCPAAASISTWYLLRNLGDTIRFVSDQDPMRDPSSYDEVTDQMVDQLISEGTLRDDGYIYQDEDDPEAIFVKQYTNIWSEPEAQQDGRA